MSEVVGVLDDGGTAREMSKAELLDHLKAEADRAKKKIQHNNTPGEPGGLRGRLDACERLHAQVSPLTDKNIAEASEKGSWKDRPFPIEVEKRLAELADDLIIA